MHKSFDINNVITNEDVVETYLKSISLFTILCNRFGYIPNAEQYEQLYQICRINRFLTHCNHLFSILFRTQSYYLYETNEHYRLFSKTFTDEYDKINDQFFFDDLTWQTDKGKIGKRLAKYVYKTFNTNITGLINMITTTIRGYYYDNYKFEIVIDDDFNWKDGDFGDKDSCIFSEDGCNRYFYYRLKPSEAQAIKVYNERGNGVARALLFKPDNYTDIIKYIMINGYGKSKSIFSGCSHDSLVIDRLAPFVGEMLGLKPLTRSYVEDYDSFFINNRSGIIFVDTDTNDQEIANLMICTPVIHIIQSENEWQCKRCENWFSDDEEINDTDDGDTCNSCLGEYYHYCESCGNYYDYEGMTYISDTGYLCETCLEDNYQHCDYCDEYKSVNSDFVDFHGQLMCGDCLENFECSICHEHVDLVNDKGLYHERTKIFVCTTCLDKIQEVQELKDTENTILYINDIISKNNELYFNITKIKQEIIKSLDRKIILVTPDTTKTFNPFQNTSNITTWDIIIRNNE